MAKATIAKWAECKARPLIGPQRSRDSTPPAPLPSLHSPGPRQSNVQLHACRHNEPARIEAFPWKLLNVNRWWCRKLALWPICNVPSRLRRPFLKQSAVNCVISFLFAALHTMRLLSVMVSCWSCWVVGWLCSLIVG